MTAFEEYYGFMERFTAFYIEAQKCELEKFDALMSCELPRIQEAMNNYQSVIKKAQAYEEERIELCKKLGFENMAFSEVLRHFDDDEKTKLTEQKNRLTSIVKNIKYLNKRSMDFVNVQLGEIEQAASISAIYNTKGLADSHLSNSNLLNKSI
ncbi:flagellar export chaperone FlgN [Ruminococcus sp. NK3A76]|uniref:flagellar export chaperone FlgN n=1 Tax=Ruminococcus sp. NK3A76 TaxID=877411 RepID=UPI00048CF97C|nr:flagellar export chaperone FlgN [Ruminococcus sp. NK3A76]